MTEPGIALDFAFLDAQTFGDVDLSREVLALFVEQSRRLLPTLPLLDAVAQAATAHLLKGSCQGIGASAAADLLQRYEDTSAACRNALYPDLSKVFAHLELVIAAHLDAT